MNTVKFILISTISLMLLSCKKNDINKTCAIVKDVEYTEQPTNALNYPNYTYTIEFLDLPDSLFIHASDSIYVIGEKICWINAECFFDGSYVYQECNPVLVD